MTTKVVTNNQPRDIIDAYQLTADERQEFDYLDWTGIDAGTDSASFFRYRGQLHDLGTFMRGDPAGDGKWNGSAADSFFSGTVIRLASDGESVVVGRMYS